MILRNSSCQLDNAFDNGTLFVSRLPYQQAEYQSLQTGKCFDPLISSPSISTNSILGKLLSNDSARKQYQAITSKIAVNGFTTGPPNSWDEPINLSTETASTDSDTPIGRLFEDEVLPNWKSAEENCGSLESSPSESFGQSSTPNSKSDVTLTPSVPVRNFECQFCYFGFELQSKLDLHISETHTQQYKVFEQNICETPSNTDKPITQNKVNTQNKTEMETTSEFKIFALKNIDELLSSQDISNNVLDGFDEFYVRDKKLNQSQEKKQTENFQDSTKILPRRRSTYECLDRKHPALSKLYLSFSSDIRKSYRCLLCPSSSNFKHSLRRHIRQAHKNQAEALISSGKWYQSHESITQLAVKRGKKASTRNAERRKYKMCGYLIQCNFCPKQYDSYPVLLQHERQLHGVAYETQSPYACIHCGETFRTVAPFKSHIRNFHKNTNSYSSKTECETITLSD